MSPQDEQLLIGYLLDALDPEQRQQVAQRICQDPLWQRQAQYWRRVLHELEPARFVPEPPPQLVQRTMQTVRQGTPAATALSAQDELFGRSARWSVLDVVLTAVVISLAALLLLPAMGYQRFRAQVLHCSDNLRYLGQALSHYHHTHNHFP